MKTRGKLERERIYGPWSYRAWGYGLGCVVVGCETRDRRPGSVQGMEECHVRTGGTGRKATWRFNTFFACWRHHSEQGNCGIHTFAERYELAVDGEEAQTLSEAAELTTKLYDLRQGDLSE